MKMQERDRILREKAENKGREQGWLEGKTSAIQSFIRANRTDGVSEAELNAQLQKYFQLTPEESEKFLSDIM